MAYRMYLIDYLTKKKEAIDFQINIVLNFTRIMI